MSDPYPLAIFGDTLANADMFELQSLQDDQRVNCFDAEIAAPKFPTPKRQDDHDH